MLTQIQRLIFKAKGMIPYQYHVSMPVNQDDSFLFVFVQWDQDDEWVTFPLRIELHTP